MNNAKNATRDFFKKLTKEVSKTINVIGTDIKILCINTHRIFTDPQYGEPQFLGTIVACAEKLNGNLILLLRDEKLVVHLNFTNCLKRIIDIPELNINITLHDDIISEIKNLSTTGAEPSDQLKSIINTAWQQADDSRSSFQEWYDTLDYSIVRDKEKEKEKASFA